MELRLEVVQVPVSDVDRAKAFYTDQLGFVLDHDVEHIPGMRVVQLTPPGSAASIVIGTGMTGMVPGSLEGPDRQLPDRPADIGQTHVAPDPLKQRHSQGLLQTMHRRAHRPLRTVELLRSGRDMLVLRDLVGIDLAVVIGVERLKEAVGVCRHFIGGNDPIMVPIRLPEPDKYPVFADRLADTNAPQSAAASWQPPLIAQLVEDRFTFTQHVEAERGDLKAFAAGVKGVRVACHVSALLQHRDGFRR